MNGKPHSVVRSDLVRVVGIDDNRHENIEVTNISNNGINYHSLLYLLINSPTRYLPREYSNDQPNQRR